MTNFIKPLLTSAIMAAATFPAIAQPAAPDTGARCSPIMATVYFADGQAELSTAATQALEAQTELAEGCIISKIDASVTSSDGDDRLSQARSTAVLMALSDFGIATVDTKTDITGVPTTGRVIKTARRVELTLKTLPKLNNS